jgi:hypothetical protein
MWLDRMQNVVGVERRDRATLPISILLLLYGSGKTSAFSLTGKLTCFSGIARAYRAMCLRAKGFKKLVFNGLIYL